MWSRKWQLLTRIYFPDGSLATLEHECDKDKAKEIAKEALGLEEDFDNWDLLSQKHILEKCRDHLMFNLSNITNCDCASMASSTSFDTHISTMMLDIKNDEMQFVTVFLKSAFESAKIEYWKPSILLNSYDDIPDKRQSVYFSMKELCARAGIPQEAFNTLTPFDAFNFQVCEDYAEKNDLLFTAPNLNEALRISHSREEARLFLDESKGRHIVPNRSRKVI